MCVSERRLPVSPGMRRRRTPPGLRPLCSSAHIQGTPCQRSLCGTGGGPDLFRYIRVVTQHIPQLRQSQSFRRDMLPARRETSSN